MGQEFKINDCGEIIREKLPKKRNVILRVILGIIALACIIIAFPFIVGMIRYGEGIPGDNLGDYLWKKTKRRPMILPIIQEV